MSASEHPKYDALLGTAERLVSILKEEEFGLFTWHGAVRDLCTLVGEFGNRAPSPVVAEVVRRLRLVAGGVRPTMYVPSAENEDSYHWQLADELDGLADRLERGE